jgi:DNA ligase-4
MSRIIHAALNLPSNPDLPAHPLLASRSQEANHTKTRMTSSIILEAEVVPYNESSREGGRGPGIEEFWHLGAAGVTPDTTQQGQEWKNRNRHLCLVFFDVLHLDGRNLLDTPYDERRRCLERVVKVVPGFVSSICEGVGTVADG